jgi:hypothetical protein
VLPVLPSIHSPEGDPELMSELLLGQITHLANLPDKRRVVERGAHEDSSFHRGTEPAGSNSYTTFYATQSMTLHLSLLPQPGVVRADLGGRTPGIASMPAEINLIDLRDAPAAEDSAASAIQHRAAAHRRASVQPASVALMAEQVLERIEVPAHGIDVAQETHQVLLRCIELASQRRHGIDEGLPVLAHITTTALQPAAQGAVGNADAIRGAMEAAVARDSASEELGQRRGRDDDATGC